MSSLILLVAMFVLMWVSSSARSAGGSRAAAVLSSVEPGDEILTVGGLYGIVHEIDEDDDLIVEIAEGIQVRISRRAVGGVVKPETRRTTTTIEASTRAEEADDEAEPSSSTPKDSVSGEPRGHRALDRR